MRKKTTFAQVLEKENERKVKKIASKVIPLSKATIVIHLQFLSNDEWYISIGKTLLEHD